MKRVRRAEHTPLGFQHLRLRSVPRVKDDLIACHAESNRGESGPLFWQDDSEFLYPGVVLSKGSIVSGMLTRFVKVGQSLLFLSGVEVCPGLQPSEGEECETEAGLKAPVRAADPDPEARIARDSPRDASACTSSTPPPLPRPVARRPRSARRKMHLVAPETLLYDEC